MSTAAGGVQYPTHAGEAQETEAAIGLPRRLEKASWFFSLFLIIFPVVAVVGTYVRDGEVLLSVPLLLMAVCGGFGMRLSVHLEKA